MVDWKKCAIDDLRKYRQLQLGAVNLSSEIRELQADITSAKSAGGSSPVRGGGSKQEDRIINNIVKREKLKANLKIVRHQLEIIERGLRGVTDNECTILTAFYIDPPSKPVELLKDKLHLEQSQIYRLKDIALYKFTVSMYGIVDL